MSVIRGSGGSADEAGMAATRLLDAFGQEHRRLGEFVRWVFDS